MTRFAPDGGFFDSPRLSIGLSGYAQSGKSEVAKHLIRNHGYYPVNFADPLREAMTRLDPIVSHPTGMRYSTAVAALGYESAKEHYSEVRRLLQVLGTEVGRGMFGEDFWVDLWAARAAGLDRVVAADCRFPNEAAAIRSGGGRIIRVLREGYGPVNGHPSETGLEPSESDWYIRNDGDLPSLHKQVDDLIRRIHQTEGIINE